MSLTTYNCMSKISKRIPKDTPTTKLDLRLRSSFDRIDRSIDRSMMIRHFFNITVIHIYRTSRLNRTHQQSAPQKGSIENNIERGFSQTKKEHTIILHYTTSKPRSGLKYHALQDNSNWIGGLHHLDPECALVFYGSSSHYPGWHGYSH